MPRTSRIVCPGIAHHVTQRGNRKEPIFFCRADARAYLRFLIAACEKSGTRCLAWCLMPNHVHLVLVPKDEDGLRGAIAPAHSRYTQRMNVKQGWSGHLFQGRFASYPMDDAHLMVAVRYVELNPVRAGLVARPEDWLWSSAGAHLTGQADGLTAIAAVGRHVSNWSAFLADGVEAADRNDAIETALRTGRPLGRVSAGVRGDSHLLTVPKR